MQITRVHRFLIFILTVLFASCKGSGSSQRTYESASASLHNTTRGKEIFEQRCIACHGLNGNYRNMNAANLQTSTLDSISIIMTIQNGRNQMPMFDHVMPDSDLAQLEMYVMTLRK